MHTHTHPPPVCFSPHLYERTNEPSNGPPKRYISPLLLPPSPSLVPSSKLSIDPARGGVNTLVWVGALTAAAGGVYWYSTATSTGAAEKEKADARAREMKAKADAKLDEGKTKANELKVGFLFIFRDTCTD